MGEEAWSVIFKMSRCESGGIGKKFCTKECLFTTSGFCNRDAKDRET